MCILEVYKRVSIKYRLIFAMTGKQSCVVSQRVIVIRLWKIKFSRILKELFILHPNHSVPSLFSVFLFSSHILNSNWIPLPLLPYTPPHHPPQGHPIFSKSTPSTSNQKKAGLAQISTIHTITNYN